MAMQGAMPRSHVRMMLAVPPAGASVAASARLYSAPRFIAVQMIAGIQMSRYSAFSSTIWLQRTFSTAPKS